MPIGLPLSEFLSWSPDDQDLALAFREIEAERCSECGTDPREWLTPDGKPAIPPPYEVGTHVCLGCKALAQSSREREEHNRPDDPSEADEGIWREGLKQGFRDADPDEYGGHTPRMSLDG